MNQLIDHIHREIYAMASNVAKLGPDVEAEDLMPLWRHLTTLHTLSKYLAEEAKDYRPMDEKELRHRDAMEKAMEEAMEAWAEHYIENR